MESTPAEDAVNDHAHSGEISIVYQQDKERGKLIL